MVPSSLKFLLRPSCHGLSVSLFFILCVLSIQVRGAEEEFEGGGDSNRTGDSNNFFSDPTLGGRLHLTYRVSYTAKVFDFKRYQYPFAVTNPAARDQDRAQADLLEERRKDISDQDVDQRFALRLDQLPVLEGRSKVLQSAGGEASFRFFKDLDGSPAGEEARNGFDRFGHREAFQLQTLSTRLEMLNRHLELVLGRQYGRESEWLHFDGATATLKGLAILGREAEVSGFAGSRVTFYPRSASSLDGMYGGHLKAWLLDSTRLRLSEVYYADSSFEAEVRHELGGLGWLAVSYRQINEDPHSVLLESNLEWLKRAVSLYFLYVGKLGRNADDFNFDYTQSSRRRRDGDKDMYFNIGDIEPYDEATLEARKGLWNWLGVFGGGTVHRLRERDLEDSYNTDWQEAWLGFDLADAFWKGFSGRGTVRYVHTDLPRRRLRLNVDDAIQNGVPDFLPGDVTGDGEPSFLGVEALVEQDFWRIVVVGGTAVFRAYDSKSNFAELDSLRAASLGVHMRWNSTAWTQILLGYTYDTDYRFINPDLDAVHTVRLQLLVRW